MSVRRHLAGTLAVPLLVVALTACGGGDDSVADPPISSPPTSSPTQAPHRESAEHFIRRWAAAEKQMENTGQTDAYLAISAKCRACRELAADVHRYYSAGGMIQWGGWHFLSLRSEGTNGADRVFVARVQSAPTRYKVSASSPLRRLTGGPTTHQLTIGKVAGSWQMLVKAQVAS